MVVLSLSLNKCELSTDVRIIIAVMFIGAFVIRYCAQQLS